MNIPLRVKNLVKKYDTADPYRIAKELKFEIKYFYLPQGVNGMWRRILRKKYLVINRQLEEWQQRAVICHELAHFRCHPGYKSYSASGRTFFSSTRKENEANEYAADLMGYSCDMERRYVLDFLENGWKIKRSSGLKNFNA